MTIPRSRSGRASTIATVSQRWSVIAFGTSSPRTTLRYVRTRNASDERDAAGQEAEEARDERLAEGAEQDPEDGDPDLDRRDVAHRLVHEPERDAARPCFRLRRGSRGASGARSRSRTRPRRRARSPARAGERRRLGGAHSRPAAPGAGTRRDLVHGRGLEDSARSRPCLPATTVSTQRRSASRIGEIGAEARCEAAPILEAEEPRRYEARHENRLAQARSDACALTSAAPARSPPSRLAVLRVFRDVATRSLVSATRSQPGDANRQLLHPRMEVPAVGDQAEHDALVEE